MVVEMKPTRTRRTETIEDWANRIDQAELVEIDSDELKAIAQFAARRDLLEDALIEAVRAARQSGRSWSEIGTMLGVSKQAAQRKYTKLAS